MRLSADHLLCSRNRKPRRYQAEPVWEDAGFWPRPCPVFDEVRGRVVEMYVSLKPGFSPSKEIEAKVTAAIETDIGKIAWPKNIWIVPGMPKSYPVRSCAG